MKKFSVFIVILAFLFVINSCSGLLGTDDEKSKGKDKPSGPGGPAPAKFSKDFWGEWIRMDTGDEWYISSNSIKVNDRISSTSASLTKQSNRVIEVADGSRRYYLYASRTATSHFSGRVVGDTGAEAVSRSAGSGVGGIEVIISNLNDETDTIATTTDDDGNFTADEIIAGDEYEIDTGGQTTVVSPNADGDDVGTITITEGVNFKTSVKPKVTGTDMNRLYANLYSYALNIEIENTGTKDCTAAIYSLDLDKDLVRNSGSLSGVLGTIEPKKKKVIELTIACKAIQDEYEFKKIGITIDDTISGKSWDDSVSVKFNKVPIDFNVRSNKPVSGVIIAPNAKAYSFKTAGSGALYSASLTMPWSTEDYLVVFSGATADTEAVYSLGINVIPDTNFTGFLDLGNYEPNDTEDTATPIYMQEKIMSYLHKNDIDYFKINLGTAAPEVKPVSITAHAIKDYYGNNDEEANPCETNYLDIRVRNNTNSTVNITSLILSTADSDVTIDNGTAAIGNLNTRCYKTLTDFGYSYSSAGDAALLYSGYLSRAFRFTIDKSCSAGTVLPFTVTFTDSFANTWTDTLEIPVVATGANIGINTPSADNVSIREAANGNNDGEANPRETHYLDIRVKNSGTSNALGLQAFLSSTSGYVTIDNNTASIGDLNANHYKTLTDYSYNYSSASGATLLFSGYLSRAFRFTIADVCPAGIDLPFTVTFTDSWGNVWTDAFTVPVVATGANISINTPIENNFSIRNVTSNVNNQAKPNSTQYLDIRVKNSGTSNALGLQAFLSSTSGYATIDNSTSVIGDLNVNNFKTLTDYSYNYTSANGATLLNIGYLSRAFRFTIAGDCPAGIDLPFTVTFTDSWGNVWTDALSITVE